MTPFPAEFSTSYLVTLVHQYYPPNLWEADEGYARSEQYLRLVRARQEALNNAGPWQRLLAQLRGALPDCRVEDWSVLFSTDNCWRVRVYLPEVLPIEGGQELCAVVVLVSILAPVYVRYSSFHRRVGSQWSKPTLFYEDVPQTQPLADKVEALVSSGLGVHPVPHDTLFTPVPDIQCGNRPLGDAQLIDCLWTSDRW
jgi:hypothetical protein